MYHQSIAMRTTIFSLTVLYSKLDLLNVSEQSLQLTNQTKKLTVQLTT